MKQSLILFLVAALALTCCTRGSLSKRAGEPSDSLYTEQKAMSIHLSDPDRALIIIDSAVIVGNVTDWRADYLRALVYYGGYQNFDKSKALCEGLVNTRRFAHSKWNGENADSITTMRAWVLLAYLARSMSSTAEIIRCASEAAQMAHALGDVSEEARMSGLIAETQSKAGLADDAIEQLSKTREKVKSINSFPGVNAYFSVSKRLLHVLSDNKRYEEMTTVCDELLERINHFAEHISQYEGISEGLDLSEFIDLARGQTYAFLTAAYAEMGNRTEALKNEQLMRQTK